MNVLRFTDLFAQGQVAGQRVFIRADLNVPQDDAGNITEDTRVRASVPCIQHGAGRRRRRDGHLAPGPSDRGRVQARGLARAGRQAPGRTAGPRRAAGGRLGRRRRRRSRARSCCSRTAASTRARRRTTTSSRKKMAALCDIFVNDAFGTAHRAEATTYGIARVRAGRLRRPAAGRRDRRHHARRWRSPKRPLVAIVAGCKVSHQADHPAGAGRQGRRPDRGRRHRQHLHAGGRPEDRQDRWPSPTCVDEAKAVIEAMKARGAAVPIPTDVVVAKKFAADARGHRQGRRPTSPTTT